MPTDTQHLAPTDAEIVALLGDRRYSTVGAVREAITRWGAQSTPSSAAEFALNVLVAAGHVSQELVDRALALPGAPQPVAREPLSEAQREEIIEAVDWYNFPRDVIDAVERAHGIKGGQHGADT